MEKQRSITGEVGGHQAQLVPGEEGRAGAGEPTKGRPLAGDEEEGEVRAPSDAVEPRSGKIGDEISINSGGMCPGLILGILKTASRMFAPGEELPSNALQQLAMDAIASTDGNYGIKEAVKWAEGFEFPQELVDSDLKLFRASALDFTKMVEMRFKKIGDGRLSAYRVEQLRLDNPERSRLFDIAEGMRVPLPEGFTPNAKG